jgi:hypothetical protein
VLYVCVIVLVYICVCRPAPTVYVYLYEGYVVEVKDRGICITIIHTVVLTNYTKNAYLFDTYLYEGYVVEVEEPIHRVD